MDLAYFWVLLLSGTVTLFFGQVAGHIERGGRRGRLRHEIREDLELVKQLDDWPVFQDRIRNNLDELLAQYAPGTDLDDLDDELPSARVLLWAALVLSPVALAIAGVFTLGWWESVGIGAVLGVLVNIVAAWLSRRRRRAEKDPARDQTREVE